MIIDSRELTHGSLLQYDVCIVGAGAAGITLARMLKSSERSICILESGAFQPENDVQALCRGATHGVAMNPDNYLDKSRLRYFGGTTNHWTGFCRPLDALDFEKRPWVPHSGWPIDRNELATHYERAAEVVRIKPFESWGDVAYSPDAVMPPSDAFVAKRFHFSPVRFGRVYRDELQDAWSVNVILHANVVDLEVDDAGSTVSRVHVATLSGRRLAVAARLVVLAAGAVENARLLLTSDAKHKTGLGNRFDHVGRYFMDHPAVGGGLVCLTNPAAALRLDDLGGYLGLSEETQRKHEILNVCVNLNPRRNSPGESEAGGTPLELRDLLYRIAALDGPGIPADAGHDYRYRRCFIHVEPAPYPDSRVTLDSETDALGVRRVRLVWKTSARETTSIHRAKELLGVELGRRGIGRMLLGSHNDQVTVPLGEAPWEPVTMASHHMGTTRMSASPSDGVVDRNCQVHDVSNLFVAGSSVFPTVGFANPTFTIVALAIRLAEHLVARLES